MVDDATPRLVDLDHHAYAIKTWRYLRLAMVAVVFGLAVAVVTERLKAKPGCFLPSVSAYYYTPVRGYFVAATLALGLCLICLRGNTEIENVLLNFAGMLAPVVAFVPTEYSPKFARCASVPIVLDHTRANVTNNILALLVVAAIVLLLIGFKTVSKGATVAVLVSTAAAGLLWVSALVVFLFARGLFVESAHFAAAVPMFLCIAGAAIVNARDVDDSTKRASYVVIAATMVGLPLAIGAGGLLMGSGQTLIAVRDGRPRRLRCVLGRPDARPVEVRFAPQTRFASSSVTPAYEPTPR